MDNSVRHITIGLLRESAAWRSLLDQIGVHWEIVSSVDSITVNGYSLVVCNQTLTHEDETALQKYAAQGGALLYLPVSGNVLKKGSVRKHYVTSLPPVDIEGFHCSEILDLFSEVHYFRNGTFAETEILGSGILSFLGIEIEALMEPVPPLRKSFYTGRERLPHELVARRSRSAVRQLVQSHLEFLHHRRGLPFVHKWFYPGGQETLFTFRIDSDKGTQSQVEEIFQLSERYDIPTTWFLDVKSHEPWLAYFKKFLRQELGVHCYEHAVFTSTLLNRENFEKALTLLRKHGFQPVGIAAPTGAWSSSIGSAIRDLGFSYSSEFAYDYDDLPSFPLIGDELSPVVQLPVHPTCIGTMRREQISPEEMVQYFISVIEQKLTDREPICLYHHPGHETNSVFEEVFRYINGAGIVKMSYAEYAAWWNRRQKFTVRAGLNGTQLTCDVQNGSDDTYIRITGADTTEIITPAHSPIDISSGMMKQRPHRRPVPDDLMRTRKWRLRHTLQNALDWWIKTTE